MVVITDKGEGWTAVRDAGRAGVPTAETAGPQGGPGWEGGSAEGGQDEPPDCPETESAPRSGGNLTDPPIPIQGLHPTFYLLLICLVYYWLYTSYIDYFLMWCILCFIDN